MSTLLSAGTNLAPSTCGAYANIQIHETTQTTLTTTSLHQLGLCEWKVVTQFAMQLHEHTIVNCDALAQTKHRRRPDARNAWAKRMH